MRRENRRWEKEAVLCISEVWVVMNNMLVSLIRTDANKLDGDDAILCDMYEYFLDGMDDAGVDSVGDSVHSANEGPNETIENKTSSFVENAIIREFIKTSRIGFESLKKNLVERFSIYS